jgi:signal transduction histidine kinase
MCHELSNLLVAVRLHASLIDPDVSPIELTSTSVEIESAAARATALLALLRALSTGVAPARSIAAQELFAALESELREYGARGVLWSIRTDGAEDLPRLAGDFDLLRNALGALVFSGIEAARPRGRVDLSVVAANGELVFAVEDDGREEADLLEGLAGAERGRALVCALVDTLLAPTGSVRARRAGERTRIELRVPQAGP